MSLFTTLVITFNLLLAAPLAALPAPLTTINDCPYYADGAGSFNTHFLIDFTQTNNLPSVLTTNAYTVGAYDSPYTRSFCEDNIMFNDQDSVSLLVPGEQSLSPIRSAEFRTAYGDILYGSVRTVALASAAAGSTHGMFFYHNDTQETDIEILTCQPDKVHFTNQPTNGGTSVTRVLTHPVALADDYHEYRIDWLQGQTLFYIDGILYATVTEDVPSIPSYFIWNNWSNGGSWSEGPPVQTSDFKIKSIEAYFNRTMDPSSQI